MKCVLYGILLLLVPFLRAADEDTVDKVMKDQISLMSEMSDVLATIKDKDSAEKARTKLEVLQKKHKDIEGRAEKLKLKDLPKEKHEALKKKYEKDVNEVVGRFSKEFTRLVTNKEVAEVLSEIDLFGTGKRDSVDKVVKDQVARLNELSDILDTVKDGESAQKAKAKLEALKKQGKDLAGRGKKLGLDDLSNEKKEELEKKYGASKAAEKLRAGVDRVLGIAQVADHLRDTLKDIGK